MLLAWPKEWENDKLKTERFVKAIDHAYTIGHCITILKPQKDFDNNDRHTGFVDIWSFNFEKGMLLLIAHILKSSKNWKACTFRLFVVTSIQDDNLIRIVREFLDKYRLFPSIEITPVSVPS